MSDWDARPAADDRTTSDGPTGDVEVDQLVGEIEDTRGEMTTTVEQIGDRLDPKNIVADAKETVREATVGKVEHMANTAGDMVSNAGQTAQEAGSGLIETLRRNPVPTALAGIGLGWLAMSARSSQQQHRFTDQARYYGGSGGRYGEGYGPGGYGAGYGSGAWDTGRMGDGGSGGRGIGEQVGDRVGEVGQAAGGAVSQVQQTAGEVAGQVGQAAGEVVGNVQQTAGQFADRVGSQAGQAQYQVQGMARQVSDSAGRMFQDNPLAVGAIAVAVGTAVGLALPSTQAERQVLGQARDDVLSKAETAASDALSQAEDQARDMEQQARSEDQAAQR